MTPELQLGEGFTSSEELMTGPLCCRSSKDVLLCTGAGHDVLHGGAPAISPLW